MKVKNKNVVVRDISDESESKVFVPKHFKDKLRNLVKAEVVGVSDEHKDRLPVGSTVLYQKNAGMDIEHEEETLRVIRFGNIMAAQV